MRVVQANNTETINIGRQLENLATEVVFDLSNWIAEFGDGAAALIVRRVGDSNTYPVSLERQDSKATWKVTNSDTELAQKGRYGRCELRWYVGDVLAKSNIWKLYVEPSMVGQSGQVPPSPEQSWLDKVLEAGTIAENAATNAKDSASEAAASEAAAKASEEAAKASETAAKASETAAAESASAAQQAADEAKADADTVATLAEEVSAKAIQTANNATLSAQAKEAAQTAQRLAEAAQQAAETARTAANAAQVAAEQSATDAAGAKRDAETAMKSAQDAAAAAAKALTDIQVLYQEMQTWANSAIQSINNAGSTAVQSVQSAGNSQVRRVTVEGTTQTANAKAQADAAALSAAGAAQSAHEAAESAAVYDNVVSDVTQLKQDISNLRFGDPYDGVDLVTKFADEISGYTDPGAWIRARIRANNFDGIHVNDYIQFTTTNGLSFKARVAGIDPYYEYGDSAVGHHIDFICEELWPTLKPINSANYNNGLIPTENVTSDGTETQYVLTKPMHGVAKVTFSGTGLTGWTYDKDTYTLTFSSAPAAGTMVVTGTGSEYPWLSSDAYLYVNSLAGHVANGTGLNPAIKRVDYSNDGIYHYLPDWLKAVIIEKRFLLNKRYSASGVLSDENDWGWVNIGKLWFPTEAEVYGCPVWGSKGGYGLGGSIQYPLFMGNMRRLKKRNGSRYSWWLLSPYPGTADWCNVHNNGAAGYNVASNVWIATPVCFRVG